MVVASTVVSLLTGSALALATLTCCASLFAVLASAKASRGRNNQASKFEYDSLYDSLDDSLAPPDDERSRSSSVLGDGAGAASSSKVRPASLAGRPPPALGDSSSSAIAIVVDERPYSAEVEYLRGRVRAGHVLLAEEMATLEQAWAVRAREQSPVSREAWSA